MQLSSFYYNLIIFIKYGKEKYDVIQTAELSRYWILLRGKKECQVLIYPIKINTQKTNRHQIRSNG